VKTATPQAEIDDQSAVVSESGIATAAHRDVRPVMTGPATTDLVMQRMTRGIEDHLDVVEAEERTRARATMIGNEIASLSSSSEEAEDGAPRRRGRKSLRRILQTSFLFRSESVG
jgi:hypothetical protein